MIDLSSAKCEVESHNEKNLVAMANAICRPDMVAMFPVHVLNGNRWYSTTSQRGSLTPWHEAQGGLTLLQFETEKNTIIYII